jgi:hypothetical protein
VIQGEVARLATAVLARVAVAREDLAPRQLDPRPGPSDLVLEAYHGRRSEARPRRSHHLVVVLENFRTFSEDQPEGTRQIAHVERFVVLVQDQYHALHEGIVPEDRLVPAALPAPD